MNYRKNLLAVMLVALGLAALGGAAGMLFGSKEDSWIVVVIGILTAVACGLLMAISRLYDAPKTRPGAMLLTAAVIGCLVLTCGAILARNDDRMSELLGTSALAVALAALPAAFFLRVSRSAGNGVAGYVGLAAVAGGAAAMIVGNVLEFVTPDRWVYHYSEHLWEIGSIVAGAGMLAAGALAGSNRFRPWRWIGVIAALFLGILGCFEVWSDSYKLDEMVMLAASIATFVAYLNVALLVEVRSGQGWLMAAAVASTGLTLAVADARAFVSSKSDMTEVLDRFLGALSLIAGCATVAILVVVRITQKTRDVAAPVEIKEISLTCPSCSAKQSLPIGESACGSCGLKIFIRLEMPRCPKCDYSLLMNPSDRCPECGTELRPARPGSAQETPLPVG